jgi:RNA recognition motif-containing protein
MQGSQLYVGNLNYSVVNDDLQELFSNYGLVEEVKVIEGKGFGFVEMSTQAEAEKAKEALSGFDLWRLSLLLQPFHSTVGLFH